MKRSSPSVSRRNLVRGAVATSVGLSFAGLPVVQVRRASAQETKVTWMSNQRHDRAVKEDLFARFAEESGITVEMQIFADEYPDQLKLAFESGNPPDMFNLNQPRQQAEAGWAEPLDDYLAATPGLQESFIPGSFLPNQGIYGGKIHGLPMYAQTMRLYYNKTLFSNSGLDPEAPPTTWTQMREFAKAISDNSGGAYGLIMGDKFPWVWEMYVAFLANGGGAYKFDWAANQYNFNQQPIKDALQLYVDSNAEGGMFPGIHTLTDDDARQQFSIGMAGMIIGGSWNPGVFNDQFSSTEDWETALMPLPDAGLTGRFKQYIGDRYTISAQSANKEACWEVLKWLYSEEIMTEMYARGMGVMGVAAANTGVSEVRGISALAPTANDVIPPPEPELPTITPDWVTVFQGIYDDGGSTADAKLDELTTVYNQTYADAVADGSLVAEDYLFADWDGMTWTPSPAASPEATPTA